ncbi:Thaumatin pathogenesis-related protein [Streptomyces sp. NBC_00510]
MARHSRHGTGSRTGRGRWAAVAVLAAAGIVVTALIAGGTLSPFRPGGATAEGGRGATTAHGTSAAPSRGTRPSASPSPSATLPSRSARPSGTPGPTAGTATKAPGTRRTPAATAPPGTRLITLVNRTQETVWAVVTDSPAYPRGRRLAPRQGTSLTVPDGWGGRIWGRTGCDSTAAGPCRTGDCTSVCTGPNPPTTLGEFSFDAYAGMDFYDVSMVDGANLPMYINISHTTTRDPVSPDGCYRGACTEPVDCPAAMQAKAGGQVIGCKPPCAAFGGDVYCCRGAWAGREHCVPSKWPVDYTRVFKDAAPYAYSYAYDDAATMACKGRCDYRVTFGTTG